MAGSLHIEPATRDNFDDLLDLIAGYQEFYRVTNIDRDRNRKFFSRFLSSRDEGRQFIAYLGDRPVGFTTLYFPYSSTRAAAFALMNDLYVNSAARGQGVGKALIEKASQVAAESGYESLSWMTAQDNATAQRLYDRFEVGKSAWFEYSLATKNRS